MKLAMWVVLMACNYAQAHDIYRAQHAVPLGLGLAAAVVAVAEGSESRLGRAAWDSAESFAASAVLAKGLQRLTRQTGPDGSYSFPSTHVSVTTAAVTPIMLAYKDEHPAVLALALLPAYEMAARVNTGAHRRSDVLAGAALGAAVGWAARGRKTPWVVGLMPGGVYAGWSSKLR